LGQLKDRWQTRTTCHNTYIKNVSSYMTYNVILR
jgi:hypothetical protein